LKYYDWNLGDLKTEDEKGIWDEKKEDDFECFGWGISVPLARTIDKLFFFL